MPRRTDTNLKVAGNLIDIITKESYPAVLGIRSGKIISVQRDEKLRCEHYLIPGFVDSHVHVESSMLCPYEFSKMAVSHGTLGALCDPHEIANVLGKKGIDYMIENGRDAPCRLYFGAHSCVPATPFESSGASLKGEDISLLFDTHKLYHLAEVMNVPGVLDGDLQLLQKIGEAKKRAKKIDGHAPGLSGDELARYVAAGIDSDHECTSYGEGLEKLKHGMKVSIREGSAAKNFDALIDLIEVFPNSVMFCSDDIHPDDLARGHINSLVKRALDRKFCLYDVLRAASLNPTRHYGLDLGLLQCGDRADFLVVRDLDSLELVRAYLGGEVVYESGRVSSETRKHEVLNNFSRSPIEADSLRIEVPKAKELRVIAIEDGQLYTRKEKHKPLLRDGIVEADLDRDLLLLAVLSRYSDAPASLALAKNMGLQRGTIASSIAHDSHNIIAIGTSRKDIARAINLIVESRGGISAVEGEEEMLLALPIAGLMSDGDGVSVAREYEAIDAFAKKLGAKPKSPFMTLSFLALPVIPELKLSDRGLFDAEKRDFVPLVAS